MLVPLLLKLPHCVVALLGQLCLISSRLRFHELARFPARSSMCFMRIGVAPSGPGAENQPAMPTDERTLFSCGSQFIVKKGGVLLTVGEIK